MSEPTTKAGRALIDLLARPWVRGQRGYEEIIEGIRPTVVAIEQEAIRDYSEHIAARVEALSPMLNGSLIAGFDPFDPRRALVSRAAVLALITPEDHDAPD